MKPNWFDRLIYKLWYWRWNKILATRPDIREFFISYLKAFDVVDEGTPVKITVSIEPVPPRHPLDDCDQ